MLDNPIIVSDKKIKPGDIGTNYYWNNHIHILEEPDKIIDSDVISGILDEAKKIIAGYGKELPLIDFNRFEDRLGIIDVYQQEDYKSIVDTIAKIAHPTVIKMLCNRRDGFIEGFRKAQKLNKNKFSLEETSIMFYDMIKSISERTLRKWNPDDFGKFIESIQKPKVFDIELEMEGCLSSTTNENNVSILEEPIKSQNIIDFYEGRAFNRVKIINNKVKIIKIL